MGGAGSAEGCVRLKRCAKAEKVRFVSQEQAEARALFIVEFMRRESALRVYRCPDCNDWHLTARAPLKHRYTVAARQRA